MVEKIKQRLKEHFETCFINSYGQVGIVDLRYLFGQEHKEVEAYIREHNLMTLREYKNKHMTFTGIDIGKGVFMSPEISAVINEAIKENKRVSSKTLTKSN